MVQRSQTRMEGGSTAQLIALVSLSNPLALGSILGILKRVDKELCHCRGVLIVLVVIGKMLYNDDQSESDKFV